MAVRVHPSEVAVFVMPAERSSIQSWQTPGDFSSRSLSPCFRLPPAATPVLRPSPTPHRSCLRRSPQRKFLRAHSPPRLRTWRLHRPSRLLLEIRMRRLQLQARPPCAPTARGHTARTAAVPAHITAAFIGGQATSDLQGQGLTSRRSRGRPGSLGERQSEAHRAPGEESAAGFWRMAVQVAATQAKTSKICSPHTRQAAHLVPRLRLNN